MTFPRTLLLTWCSPDSRYAGGAAIRRLLSGLPAEQIRWCGFHAAGQGSGLPEYRAFPPPALHWRVSGSWLEHGLVDVWHARNIARQIEAWAAPFRPQILWVVPEVWAVSVARALQRRTGLPLHATLHDAPESAAMGGIPKSYLPQYRRNLTALLHQANSADAVSDELVAHLRTRGDLVPACQTLVIPPSIEAALMTDVDPVPAWPERAERVIGLCGSLRMASTQWADFLQLLGALPHPIRLLSFTPAADFPRVVLPSNVTLDTRPYAHEEADVIRTFVDEQVDACYLGVWKQPGNRVFGETSLSSKLTTYAAAARPVIVDADEGSVAWNLVARHGAGLRIGENEGQSLAALRNLLENAATWRAMAAGARRLCVEVFDLTANVARLGQQFARTAGTPC